MRRLEPREVTENSGSSEDALDSSLFHLGGFSGKDQAELFPVHTMSMYIFSESLTAVSEAVIGFCSLLYCHS